MRKEQLDFFSDPSISQEYKDRELKRQREHKRYWDTYRRYKDYPLNKGYTLSKEIVNNKRRIFRTSGRVNINHDPNETGIRDFMGERQVNPTSLKLSFLRQDKELKNEYLASELKLLKERKKLYANYEKAENKLIEKRKKLGNSSSERNNNSLRGIYRQNYMGNMMQSGLDKVRNGIINSMENVISYGARLKDLQGSKNYYDVFAMDRAVSMRRLQTGMTREQALNEVKTNEIDILDGGKEAIKQHYRKYGVAPFMPQMGDTYEDYVARMQAQAETGTIHGFNVNRDMPGLTRQVKSSLIYPMSQTQIDNSKTQSLLDANADASFENAILKNSTILNTYSVSIEQVDKVINEKLIPSFNNLSMFVNRISDENNATSLGNHFDKEYNKTMNKSDSVVILNSNN